MVQIFGTIGPSCNDPETLAAMVQEGMSGIRLNLSHSSLDSVRERILNFSRACESLGQETEIIIDLHGPEIRTGWMSQVRLNVDDLLVLKARKKTEEYPIVSVPPSVLKVLVPGDNLLIQDGQVQIEVLEELEPWLPDTETAPSSDSAQEDPDEALAQTAADNDPNPPAMQTPAPSESDDSDAPQTVSAENRAELEPDRYRRFLCKAVRGGIVRGQQSVKVVGKEIYGPVITPADHENLAEAEELGVTAIMQPFVRSGEDIDAVREAMAQYDLNLRVYAKIESQSGLQNLDSIIEKADVIVIARGDLGNAVPLWELPRIQKEIGQKCRKAGKPFMVVTQMLSSMMQKPVPTRAELTDIFNAVLEGASYIMVTGETSIGRFPVNVIQYMKKVSDEALKYMSESDVPEA